MSKQPEVPTQLQEVIDELHKNWEPICKIEITPVFEELEYWDAWYLKVTIKDFSFRFPWREEIDLKAVRDGYGHIFRSCCYAVNSAIDFGIKIGTDIYREAFLQNITNSTDNTVRKAISDFKNRN